MNYTRMAIFSTITFIPCVAKLYPKEHLATELLCACSVPCEGTLAHMSKKRWLSFRQLVRLLCPSVPLTLPQLIFELVTNQLLNHWSYLALWGWGKQLEVITTLAVSSWQQHINQSEASRHIEMEYTDTSKLSRKLFKPAVTKQKDKCSIRLHTHTHTQTHTHKWLNLSLGVLFFLCWETFNLHLPVESQPPRCHSRSPLSCPPSIPTNTSFYFLLFKKYYFAF